ncbi:MAG TPA: radical SAM protein [Armatimonadota bacterium]|jgi:radical SAM superfamily enzyme YgiQ (UPF0313 family)
MARIVLVEPPAPGYHVFSFSNLPRLGLPSLGTVLRDRGHEVKIFCPDLAPLPPSELLQADLVGLSTTTSTAPAAYRLGDFCRAHGVPVLMGGVHASFRPQEALRHADYVLRGEAEEVVGDAVDRILARSPLPGSPEADGDGEAPDLPELCRVRDLDALPVPDLSLIQGWRPTAVTPIQTSRGCPHDCSFCSVTTMFGHRYRFRSTGLVLEEIAQRRPRCIFFYDDNFAAYPARTKELLEGMLRLPHPPRWAGQVRADCVEDPELLDLMQASHCERLFIGYESASPATLQTYNKQESVEQILTSLRLLHERRIPVHGMFVLGADSDDVPGIRETVNFTVRQGVDTVQFSVLTPFPGTRQFRAFEQAQRIFERDWSRYDGGHVVFEPRHMSAATLQRETSRAYHRFYSLARAIKHGLARRYAELAIGLYAQRILLLMRWRDRGFFRRLRRQGRAPAGALPSDYQVSVRKGTAGRPA